MEIKTYEARYNLVEFSLYISPFQVTVLELLVDPDDDDDINYLQTELSSIFAVETEKQTYVFSGYEVIECYEDDNGLIKVVCTK